MFCIFATSYNCCIYSANRGASNNIYSNTSFCKCLEYPTSKSPQRSAALEYQHVFYCLILVFCTRRGQGFITSLPMIFRSFSMRRSFFSGLILFESICNHRHKNKEKKIISYPCLLDGPLTSTPFFHVFPLLAGKSHLLPYLLTLQLRQRSS